MALKKSELYSSLWKSCDELRGGMDASRSFIKDDNKNRLLSQDIYKIVDSFTRQQAISRYSRLIPLAEIAANDFNLNPPRYIDSSEPENLQDIEAHLTSEKEEQTAIATVLADMDAKIAALEARRDKSRALSRG